MKFLKKMMIFLLVLTLVMPMSAHAATKSPSKNNVKNAKITVNKMEYTGKKQTAKLTIKMGDKTLKEGKHFVVVGSRKKTKAGTYKVKIKGIGKYKGTTTVEYKIKKAKQSLKVNGCKTIKAAALNKKCQSFQIKVKKSVPSAKITYKSTNKKIKVSKTGKVTVKKGLKKGMYKVYVYASATENYRKKTRVVRITVK